MQKFRSDGALLKHSTAKRLQSGIVARWMPLIRQRRPTTQLSPLLAHHCRHLGCRGPGSRSWFSMNNSYGGQRREEQAARTERFDFGAQASHSFARRPSFCWSISWNRVRLMQEHEDSTVRRWTDLSMSSLP
jgi:hypothetical protein